MKWRANSEFLKPRHYEINCDPRVGFYLYVFESNKCVRDQLQDALEITIEAALKDYNVPKEAWRRVEE